MKNKLFIALFIVFSIAFFNISKVYANSMDITCESDQVDVGATISCTVIGVADEPISGITAAIGSDSHLEVLTDTIENVSPFGGSFHIYYGADGHVEPAGNLTIATFDVKGLTSGNGVITLRDYNDQQPMGFINGDSTRYIGVQEVNRPITVGNGQDPTPPSSDSLLTALVPNVGELDPAFTSTNPLYNMSVDFTRVGRVTFTATKSHPMASISSTTCDLPSGTTSEKVVCNITVTAEDRVTSTTYKITINNSAYTPPIPPSGDIFINRLTYDVDAVLTPTFKKDIYEYDMSVNFANIHEINFTTQVDAGVTVTGKKCPLPSSPSIESTTCDIKITKDGKSATYVITVHNTYRPDVQCDLIIRSNVYTIDQDKKIIKVNSEHSLETIKANLYSTCGEIKVFEDKVTISDKANTAEYKLERVIMPKTGNNKIIYPLAIVSVLAIIGICVFAKKKLFTR